MDLDKELKLIDMAKSYTPYIFVITDNKNLRRYCEEYFSKCDNIVVVDDALLDINDENKLIEILKKNNVLLKNCDKKVEKIRLSRLSEEENVSDEELEYALYNRLIWKREFLYSNHKSLIILSDEATSLLAVRQNASLSSVSKFYYLDDIIKYDQNGVENPYYKSYYIDKYEEDIKSEIQNVRKKFKT